MIRGKEKFLHQLYFIVDFIVMQVAFLVTWWLRFMVFIPKEEFLSFSSYALWAAIYGVIAVLVGYYVSLYSPKRKKKFSIEMFNVIQVQFISIFMLISVLYITKNIHISRLFLFNFLLMNITFLLIYRFLLKHTLREMRKKGYNKQFVLIVGAGSIGNHFYVNLKNHPEYGVEVIGFLDDTKAKLQQDVPPILGKASDLQKVLDSNSNIDEVVVALPISAHKKFNDIILTCEKAGVRALIIPDFYDILPSTPYFDTFANIPMINARDVPLDEIRNRVFKRAFDICFSLAALLVTAPLLSIIAIGVKCTSTGPILYKQERVGLNRKTFYMYKFRSMKVTTSEQSETNWTIKDDPRRTRFGTILRKTSLDELPQFFNVLKGEMSVVGPRPERPFFVEKFKEDIPSYMVKHHVRPGITGWAQVCGLRGDTSIKQRIKHDVFYIENWTILFDLKIIFKTVTNGFINHNAY